MNVYEYCSRWYEIPSRDTAARKVYAAEEKTFAKERWQREQFTAEECEQFVNRILAHPAWHSLLDDHHISRESHIRRHVRVSFTNDGHATSSFARGLELPPWARNPIVILHELAHIATPGASHHWPWREAYVRLLRALYTITDAENLAVHFAARRLRVGPPRRRNLSEAQRRELAERGRLALAEWRQRRRDQQQAATQVLQEALGVRPAAPSSEVSGT